MEKNDGYSQDYWPLYLADAQGILGFVFRISCVLIPVHQPWDSAFSMIIMVSIILIQDQSVSFRFSEIYVYLGISTKF